MEPVQDTSIMIKPKQKDKESFEHVVRVYETEAHYFFAVCTCNSRTLTYQSADDAENALLVHLFAQPALTKTIVKMTANSTLVKTLTTAYLGFPNSIG